MSVTVMDLYDQPTAAGLATAIAPENFKLDGGADSQRAAKGLKGRRSNVLSQAPQVAIVGIAAEMPGALNVAQVKNSYIYRRISAVHSLT